MLPKALTVSACLVLSLAFGGLRAQENVARVEKDILAQAAQNVEKYRKGDVEIVFRDAQGRPLQGATVEVEQVRHEFLFGCIIFDLVRDGEGEGYRDELFKRRFKELFNFAVFPFYWSGYEPRQGEVQWERLQPALDWCRANGITAKGHPLVWAGPAGQPDWLGNYSPEDVEGMLKARVQNIVGGFKGRINIFDVVNEPVNIRYWGSRDPRVWFSEPLDSVEPYVEKAYKWAHAANPEATLILNEFHMIDIDTTRTQFYNLVKMLRAHDTPVMGLGIQSHEPRDMWYPPRQVWKTFDRLAELGLPLHITEFIPQSGGKKITGGWRSGEWNETAQADFAEQYYRLAFGHPAVASINWWGLSDRDIWQPGGGLIDSEYNPKPVYERLLKLIKEEWHTSVNARTGADGKVTFRGFFGDYRLVLRLPDGRVKSWDLPVRHDEANRREFKVI